MPNATPAVSIPDALATIANASPESFSGYFKRLRKMFPDEVAEACLLFIASQELGPAGRTMAYWLVSEGRYVNILFASDALPLDIAGKALAALRSVDGDFLIRFLRAAEQISQPLAILRALALVPALGDYSVLIPLLRKLCLHTDDRVKSRAVKLLCELRPNKALIERQMLSDDPRVRANAIEALWHSNTSEATALLKSAAHSDPHHRVVGNALIGLHFQADPSALARMIELSRSPDPLFRAAMAWCFGFIKAECTIPLLYGLARDTAVVVRKRALRSLLTLQPNENAAALATLIVESTEPEPTKPEPITPGTAIPTNEKALNIPLPSFATLS
jgi:hypothetical protein